MTSDLNKIKPDTDFTITMCWEVLKKWRKDDTYHWMKQKTVDYIAPRAAFLISLIALFAHFIWACHTECGLNFQRSGAIICLSTAALYALLDWYDPKTMFLSGEKIKPTTLFNPHIMLPILASAGTAVWGYGDLIPFFGTACS